MEQDGKPDTPASTPAPAPKAGTKRKILGGLLLLMCLSLLGYYLWSRGRASTDDAFVDGHIYALTPRVAGYVTEVLVQDNQEVAPGQPLLALDPTDYQVALAQAKAALAEAQATLASLELGVPLEVSQTEQRVRAAKAELTSLHKTLAAAQQEEEAAGQDFLRAQAALQLANLELRRHSALRQSGTISQAILDETQTRQASAQAQERAAQAKRDSAAQKRASLSAELERAKANIDLAATGQDQAIIKGRQVEAQQGRVELAREKVRQAELDLSYTTVTAPAAGRVTRKKIEPGQMVSKGQALMALVPIKPGELWITANYKETQLGRIKPGQPVDLEVDAYPGLTLKGRVDSLMAGTGSAFSLFPPENASGNYVKVVQRLPVKIVLEEKQEAEMPALRVGMSVVPTIFTRQ